MSLTRTALLLSTAGVVMVVGCNSLIGLEKGELLAEGVKEAGTGVDAATQSEGGVVSDAGGLDAALSCGPGKKACEEFRSCVDNGDKYFGCGNPGSCAACNATNASEAHCEGKAGTIVCVPTCNAGYADCDNDPLNGCEVNLSLATSCGSCGKSCIGIQSLCAPSGNTFACASTCGTGEQQCGSQCVNLATDPRNCKECGTICPAPTNGTATCTDGACGVKCSEGYQLCGDKCVSVNSVESCGSCTNNCRNDAPKNTAASCQGGFCKFECLPRYDNCNNDMKGDGCEAYLYADPNCGSCGKNCSGVINTLPGFGPSLEQICCNGSCVDSNLTCKPE